LNDTRRSLGAAGGARRAGDVRALPVERRPAGEVPPQVRDSLEILRGACGSNLQAVVFFGSVLLGTSPDGGSAADLFVVVKDYFHFYRNIGSLLPAQRHLGIMTSLNRVLPPNIIYLNDPGGMRAGAKCFVVTERDLMVGLSLAARDHFFRGRLSQQVEIVYARSAAVRGKLEEYLAMARRLSLEWVPFYLPETFTVADYCLRMLEVSYAGEIRPESGSRVREVYDAQRSFFRLVYGRILDDAVAGGKLAREGERYRLAEPPVPREVRRWRRFFRRSKARATLRWFKYMLTFDDWLDYIVHKTERRTGLRVELTQAERRFPLLLLWPKVFMVLRHMKDAPPRRDASETEAEAGRGGGREA